MAVRCIFLLGPLCGDLSMVVSGNALGVQVLVQTSYSEQIVRELLGVITYNTDLATVKERKKIGECPGQSYQPPRESCRRISIRLLNRNSIDPTLRHRPPNRPLPSLKPLALPRPLHNPPAPLSPLSPFRRSHSSPPLKRIRRPSDLPLPASAFVKPFEEVDEGIYERYY